MSEADLSRADGQAMSGRDATRSDGRVNFERAGGIGRITFDRPEARNAMTWSMYQQLASILDLADADPDLRVLILRGAGGRAFVAGTDISQFTRFQSADDGIAYEQLIDGLIDRLESVRVPTVAVIEGYAVGGGLAIASACDLRICTPDAKFGLPIARTVGNCLSMRNHARLVALLGAGRTKALILTAEPLSALDAQHAGFVLEVVPHDELDTRADALAVTLLRHAPITMRVTKEAVRRIVHGQVSDGADLIREAYGSEDFREGVAAFLARRPPLWKGQ